MWEGKPTCVGETDVCETTVTHKPLSTTIHDTRKGALPDHARAYGHGGMSVPECAVKRKGGG